MTLKTINIHVSLDLPKNSDARMATSLSEAIQPQAL